MNFRFRIACAFDNLTKKHFRDIYLEFDEDTERRHLQTLIAYLLRRAFGKTTEFDHQFISAGEALGDCLCHIGAATIDGSWVKLRMPSNWIANKVRCAELIELPALIDVLDVLLSFGGQYTFAPRFDESEKTVRFPSDVTEVLCDLGLLDPTSHPSDLFLLMMLNHHFLKPENSVWKDEIELLITSLAEKTWDLAPIEFKDVFVGNSDYPLTWAEGYLERSWRYGNWLSDSQLKRALWTPHSALPWIVCRVLAGGNADLIRKK